MKIAICDDMQFFRDELASIILKYKTQKRVHIDICEFENGEDLLDSTDIFDIIFLDYKLDGIDGLSTAKILRQKNITCNIVFVTNYPEQFVYDAFEVNPYRFLVKPIDENTVVSLLNNFITTQKQLSPVTVINDGIQTNISAKDVLYLEGNGKCCIIRTSSNTFDSSKTLAQIHAMLPQYCFYRTHKSYVVNLYSVSSFDKSTLTLLNGETVKISRDKFAEFKRVYMQFIKDFYLKV